RSVVGTGIDGAVVGHRHPKIPIGADADRIAVKGNCPHAAAVAHLDLLAVGSNGIGVSVVAAGRVHATPVVHLGQTVAGDDGHADGAAVGLGVHQAGVGDTGPIPSVGIDAAGEGSGRVGVHRAVVGDGGRSVVGRRLDA